MPHASAIAILIAAVVAVECMSTSMTDESCETEPCVDNLTNARIDQDQSLNMLQVKAKAKNQDAVEEQNEVEFEEEETDATHNEAAKPKCRWCRHSSYAKKSVVLDCKYPASKGFKVWVETESYVKSYGTFNVWESPTDMSKLSCRPFGRRGASALKSKLSGWIPTKKPDAVSPRTKKRYRDINMRRWNLCNCAPGAKCGEGKDFGIKIILKSGKQTCNKEALIGTKGSGYTGKQTKTRSGYTCQRWTSMSPNRHNYTPQKKPGFGLGNHNYCRNPSGGVTIWCYTTDRRKKWEYCNPK